MLELSSRGYTEREIATTLQVHCYTVHRDLVYLRKQAHENLQHHIHQTIPEEFQKGMVGLRQNLKHVLEIAETIFRPQGKTRSKAHSQRLLSLYHGFSDKFLYNCRFYQIFR